MQAVDTQITFGRMVLGTQTITTGTANIYTVTVTAANGCTGKDTMSS
jgi:hypothetical protein